MKLLKARKELEMLRRVVSKPVKQERDWRSFTLNIAAMSEAEQKLLDSAARNAADAISQAKERTGKKLLDLIKDSANFTEEERLAIESYGALWSKYAVPRDSFSIH